jgi:glycosyltransferase involved in cell wall biosynthesis
MARRPRLLVVSHDYSLTGAPVVLLNLVGGLINDFDILVAAPFDGPLRPHFLKLGIHAIVAHNLHRDINVGGGLLLSFDLLLANTLLSFLPIHAAHQLKKPSVWYLHEGRAANQFIQAFPPIAPAFPLATCVVVPCDFSQQFYRSARAVTDRVPYGIETRESCLQAWANRPMKVLQLGAIEHRKGQDVACAAFQLLRDRDIELHIVGNPTDADYAAQVRASCASLSHVHFHPAVDFSETPGLIDQCDALIVPSRDEVTPMVILEAMAAGKPVIASAVGGIPEMIADNQTGLFFKSEDAVQLAAALTRLATDESLGRTIGRAGQEFVRRNRSIAQYRGAFLQVLHEVLNSPRDQLRSMR